MSPLLSLAENHLLAATSALWQHIWHGHLTPQENTNTPLPSNTPDTLVDTLHHLHSAQTHLRTHLHQTINH